MRHKRAIQRLVNKLGGRKPYQDEDFEKSTPEGEQNNEGEDSDSQHDS